MTISLNLNSVYAYLSMTAFIVKLIKRNSLIIRPNSMNFTILSKVAKLHSKHIFILWSKSTHHVIDMYCNFSCHGGICSVCRSLTSLSTNDCRVQAIPPCTLKHKIESVENCSSKQGHTSTNKKPCDLRGSCPCCRPTPSRAEFH